jgi:hypothetical protein
MSLTGLISINKTNNHFSSQIDSLNTTKTTTYVTGNSSPGLGQALKCGEIKPVNDILTLPSNFDCVISKSQEYDRTWCLLIS